MKKSILVVEDSKSMRQMIQLTLESIYDVHLAVDGAEGLRLASGMKYDLILSDVNMPNMDGLMMCDHIKATTPNKQTPLLFLTTESSDSMRSKGKESGAAGWILKPFSPEKLLAAIKRLI